MKLFILNGVFLGAPVGLYRAQGMFHDNLKDIKCTKFHIWHLQLHYTRMALEAAGVQIAEARVIQIHDHKQYPEFKLKVHKPPEWVSRIPKLPPAAH